MHKYWRLINQNKLQPTFNNFQGTNNFDNFLEQLQKM